MNRIAQLKALIAAKTGELEAIAGKEATGETRAAFDALEAEIRTAQDDLRRAQAAEELRRSAAAAAQPPADRPETRSANGAAQGGGEGNPAAQPPTVHAQMIAPAAQVAERRDIGLEFGGFVRAFATAQFTLRSGGDFVSAAHVAKDLYGERHPVTEAVTRAQSASDNALGGLTIPPTYAAEIIRLLGPKAIVRRRANVVPGNAIYLRGVSGCTVGYVGEMEQGKVTGVGFGTLSIGEREISAILPISQKLLRRTAYNVEGYCRDEIVVAGARFEDKQFLYGDGTGKGVKGYLHSVPAAHRFAAVNKAGPTNAEVRADVRKLLKALANADVEVAGNEPAFFMHPSVKMYLEDLYQGDLKAFPTLEGPNPTLFGYPVDTTTQIAGPGGDGGEVFFGAHRYAMVGDTVSMRISMSDQAGFRDNAGNQVNMWAQGLVALKLDMSHDFALRYEQAFAVLNGVKWGA